MSRTSSHSQEALTLIERVAIIGSGVMGSGAADMCARVGIDVLVVSRNDDTVAAGQQRVAQLIRRAVERGKLTENTGADVLKRIEFTTDLRAASTHELIIEAVPETEYVKRQVFADLDQSTANRNAILASMTSAIPITRLASATKQPERVLGLHFFNPPTAMRLVEAVPTVHTSPETLERAARFATDQLDKRVIQTRDRAGFMVNSLLIPFLLSAIRMLDSGVADAETIDLGMVEGCAHPMGPLALCDLIGLDVILEVSTALHQEFGEHHMVPPPLLRRMVEAGHLGRKTSRGFHSY
jgi:3-hydroxybutyryl-CoA dehydrogenase